MQQLIYVYNYIDTFLISGLYIYSGIPWLHRCARDYCDAAEIMSIADAMESNGMRDLGYTYINLDGKCSIHIIQN